MEQVETRPRAPEEVGAPAPRDEAEAEDGLRFDDPYWDDAFCSWSDPTLRTCVGC